MQILKVIVGSRAHGLAREDSDYDYRSVFVNPTSQILGLGPKPKDTEWVEADKAKGEKDDVTGWEIGHFLHLAMQSNPSILEVFVAPLAIGHDNREPYSLPPDHFAVGLELRALFPYVWHPERVRDAYLGYGKNQQKKMLADETFDRWRKYAEAWLRVTWQAEALLMTGVLPISMDECPYRLQLVALRQQHEAISAGQVVDIAMSQARRVIRAAERCTHTPDFDKVNEFLLDVRRRHW